METLPVYQNRRDSKTKSLRWFRLWWSMIHSILADKATVLSYAGLPVRVGYEGVLDLAAYGFGVVHLGVEEGAVDEEG